MRGSPHSRVMVEDGLGGGGALFPDGEHHIRLVSSVAGEAKEPGGEVAGSAKLKELGHQSTFFLDAASALASGPSCSPSRTTSKQFIECAPRFGSSGSGLWTLSQATP